jgi:large subunit ribosomal protein L43
MQTPRPPLLRLGRQLQRNEVQILLLLPPPPPSHPPKTTTTAPPPI